MQPQPQPPPHGSVPSHLSQANITTEQIQKYLDENKQLILAILDSQNLGKLSECAQYQAQLQKNLLYLAAIADAQTPSVRAQGGHYIQQVPMFPPGPRPSASFSPQQLQLQELHKPQLLSFQGNMGMRPGINNGMHAMHPAATLVVNSGLPVTGLSEFSQGASASSSLDGLVNRQDANVVSESAVADGQWTSGNGHGRGDTEPSSLQKRPQEAKTP
uniref:Protein SSXT n=1 Tax=Anthurium amnicola TaxID=1678845 RepID=A0A1D1YAV1_9ARAE